MYQTSATNLITAEELLERSNEFGRCELIEGAVVQMSRSGAEHSFLTARIAVLIGGFVIQHDLGDAMGAEGGFVIRRNPDTVLAPDFAFIRKGRPRARGNRSYYEGAPDLAVEVTSPSDRQSDVLEKVDEWLAAGVQSCWVVDPKTQSVMIHRADGVVLRYKLRDEIRDEPTLPGFVMKVADIFGN